FGTERPRPIDRMTVPEARSYLDAGEFPPGSLGPKVEALCRFVEAAGGLGVIASIGGADAALSGDAGTRVVR
ncbi:MAG: carbamate kinase, partial [Actinomycetota bacterium]|nr:carbamate kinase [Actinomycetota bacterium]